MPLRRWERRIKERTQIVCGWYFIEYSSYSISLFMIAIVYYRTWLPGSILHSEQSMVLLLMLLLLWLLFADADIHPHLFISFGLNIEQNSRISSSVTSYFICNFSHPESNITLYLCVCVCVRCVCVCIVQVGCLQTIFLIQWIRIV